MTWLFRRLPYRAQRWIVQRLPWSFWRWIDTNAAVCFTCLSTWHQGDDLGDPWEQVRACRADAKRLGLCWCGKYVLNQDGDLQRAERVTTYNNFGGPTGDGETSL